MWVFIIAGLAGLYVYQHTRPAAEAFAGPVDTTPQVVTPGQAGIARRSTAAIIARSPGDYPDTHNPNVAGPQLAPILPDLDVVLGDPRQPNPQIGGSMPVDTVLTPAIGNAPPPADAPPPPIQVGETL